MAPNYFNNPDATGYTCSGKSNGSYVMASDDGFEWIYLTPKENAIEEIKSQYFFKGERNR